MECSYNKNEFCTNDQCPMCADYCPVPDFAGVCKYENREEERYVLTPKGCFVSALLNHINLDEDVIDFIWRDFTESMEAHGYIQEG